jgi:hypothetical protein
MSTRVDARLEKLSSVKRANAFNELVRFMTTPAFGSVPKREIELKVIALLFGDELTAGTLPTSTLAETLGLSRTRARGLLLDARLRALADEDDATRAATLRDEVTGWPTRARLEGDGSQLRVVLDDPYVRDLLRNHAYAQSLVIDRALASEIVVLSWTAYVELLATLGVAGEELDDTITAFVDAAVARVKTTATDRKKIATALESAAKTKTSRADRLALVGIFAAKTSATALTGAGATAVVQAIA